MSGNVEKKRPLREGDAVFHGRYGVQGVVKKLMPCRRLTVEIESPYRPGNTFFLVTGEDCVKLVKRAGSEGDGNEVEQEA